ncbi:MAG: DNA-binding protein WhiA [Synergistes sp.]|nr:DNA-binding protein WhiA [Synergistes sp.]
MRSLNHTIWDEWSAAGVDEELVIDEISGIISGLAYSPVGDRCVFTLPRLFVLRRLMRIWGRYKWKDGDGAIRVIGSYQRGGVKFSISRDDVSEIFQRTDTMAKRTRNWNWVRGIFGSCGAIYLPKTGYYLAVRLPITGRHVDRVQAILRSCGFALGVRKKISLKELILRDQQDIVTFLSRIGLVNTALELENMAIYRSMRNHANKLVNCDTANINKTLQAAKEQMAIIRQIEDSGIIDELSEPLAELVAARKKNPSITLKELGQTLPKPVSKSTVEYRWRKLETILSDKLKGDEANVLRKSRC